MRELIQTTQAAWAARVMFETAVSVIQVDPQLTDLGPCLFSWASMFSWSCWSQERKCMVQSYLPCEVSRTQLKPSSSLQAARPDKLVFPMFRR
jgi:hypothetical protein